uniref:Uncharacterized protein n=1 Tax=Clytia hemisphaerica TaxID=252671 RepID=A0A7M5ULR5_9CNID|eukprot:TCONS_00034274-protein
MYPAYVMMVICTCGTFLSLVLIFFILNALHERGYWCKSTTTTTKKTTSKDKIITIDPKKTTKIDVYRPIDPSKTKKVTLNGKGFIPLQKTFNGSATCLYDDQNKPILLMEETGEADPMFISVV